MSKLTVSVLCLLFSTTAHAMDQLSKSEAAFLRQCITFTKKEQTKDLHDAIKKAEEGGMDIPKIVNAPIDGCNERLIFLTIPHKKHETLELLLENQANPNVTIGHNRTLLLDLCCIPSIRFLVHHPHRRPFALTEKVRLLVKYQANIFHTDDFRNSAFTLIRRTVEPDKRNPIPKNNPEILNYIKSHNLERASVLAILRESLCSIGLPEHTTALSLS